MLCQPTLCSLTYDNKKLKIINEEKILELDKKAFRNCNYLKYKDNVTSLKNPTRIR